MYTHVYTQRQRKAILQNTPSGAGTRTMPTVARADHRNSNNSSNPQHLYTTLVAMQTQWPRRTAILVAVCQARWWGQTADLADENVESLVFVDVLVLPADVPATPSTADHLRQICRQTHTQYTHYSPQHKTHTLTHTHSQHICTLRLAIYMFTE